eukprot:m.95046 g.95046  ORF g.95046 m.95046 type:complete len:213 (-) comp16581_c0_seq2:318-956(-)
MQQCRVHGCVCGFSPSLSGDVSVRAAGNALFKAARKGHETKVLRILNKHQDPTRIVNYKNFLGWTSLHYAAYHGRCVTAQALLQHNAEVNAATNLGWTPLHHATYKGRCEVVQVLLSNNANLYMTTDREKHTCLHCAAINGDKDIVRLLLQTTTSPADPERVAHFLEAKDIHGMTAATLARENSHAAVADEIEHAARSTAVHAMSPPLAEGD